MHSVPVAVVVVVVVIVVDCVAAVGARARGWSRALTACCRRRRHCVCAGGDGHDRGQGYLRHHPAAPETAGGALLQTYAVPAQRAAKRVRTGEGQRKAMQ